MGKRITNRIRSAYHESGHTVMCFLVGYKIKKVSIVQNEMFEGYIDSEGAMSKISKTDLDTLEYSNPLKLPSYDDIREQIRFDPTGQMAWESIGPLITRGQLEVQLLISLAGGVAESIIDNKSKIAKAISESDQEQVDILIGIIALSEEEKQAYIEFLISRAKGLLTQKWKWVDAIAQHLLEYDTIQSTSVLEIIRDTHK